MKSLIYALLLMGIMTACDSTTKNFGEHFVAQNPVSIDDVIRQLKTNPTLNNVQIEGKIEKNCMSEGCWFTIKDTNGTEILFDVLDKKFKVPTNSAGKHAIILADIRQDSSSEQKFAVSVKGLMFK